MIDQVRKDIENRLETSYHIRVSVEDLNEHQRLCVIGKKDLDLAYRIYGVPPREFSFVGSIGYKIIISPKGFVSFADGFTSDPHKSPCEDVREFPCI